MKSFEQWTRDISNAVIGAERREKEPVEHNGILNDYGKYKESYVETLDPDLIDYNVDRDGDYPPPGKWKYPCVKCGDLFDICCDPHEFDADFAYCGKDQYCMP
ncbi:MAG: hypothetical protein P8Y45_08570 [Exilibacterium sp.]